MFNDTAEKREQDKNIAKVEKGPRKRSKGGGWLLWRGVVHP